MLKKIAIVPVVLSFIGLFNIQSLYAEKVPVLVSSNDVSKYSPEDTTLGDYYVLKFQIPNEAGGTKLDWAFLEFYVDVSAVEKDSYKNRTPLIELYALNKEFSGSINTNDFEPQTLPTIRNVASGESRRLLIDITEIARSYMQTPSKNHGLIIGSLTGARDGIFTLKNDVISQGSPARIIFHFNDFVRN